MPAGTSTVIAGSLDAVSACFALNTSVAQAAESAITARSAMMIPAVCGLCFNPCCKCVQQRSLLLPEPFPL